MANILVDEIILTTITTNIFAYTLASLISKVYSLQVLWFINFLHYFFCSVFPGLSTTVDLQQLDI